nr:protein FAR1-related sequence 5-like [Tanacetum cinerariifolium]
MSFGGEFVLNPDSISNDETPDFSYPPSQQTSSFYQFNYFGYGFPLEDGDSTIPLNEIVSQIPPSIAITPVLPTMEPDDSLVMGDEDLSTISEKESNEFIKSSVEDLVPILSKSEETSGSDSDNDESLSDEDVSKENVKIYSNPLFEFDDEYISSEVNPLFDEVLQDIKSKASYDESALLVTPLSDTNEDECFDQGGDVNEINSFDIPSNFKDSYYDLQGDLLYLENLLSDDTTPNLPLEVFLARDLRSLSDINDLKITVKVFDLGVSKKIFSPTYEPHVEGIPIPVEGAYYDTIYEALDMYTKYAQMARFEIKKGGQRLTKSGAVQHKYIYCNKEGVPKGINVDALDPEYSDKQKRNTTTHVTGCKARIRLVRNIVNRRYKLEKFQPKYNHMLIPKEYKHFTKKQRKMNQSEKIFVVKAAINKIGATRAHNLLCSMKGGVENSELIAMFWADEVAKCNYKEFGDIVSFDATFNSNKYNMKFVSFIGIDNHEQYVTLGSRMLLHEDTKSYTWLLNAFMTAFSYEPTMIVTDQDGSMKRAIEAVFKKAKHRLCMWHIMQKIPSKALDKGHNTSRPKKTKKQIRGKNLTIERLTNEANFLVDDSLFLLSKDEGKMGAYVEKLKILLDEMKADMPNPPSKNTGDVIGGIFSIAKPNQIAMRNPTKAVNKGEQLKKGERLKSKRNKSLKFGKKKLRVCGFCKEKTNEHTKTTYPMNPKAKKKEGDTSY